MDHITILCTDHVKELLRLNEKRIYCGFVVLARFNFSRKINHPVTGVFLHMLQVAGRFNSGLPIGLLKSDYLGYNLSQLPSCVMVAQRTLNPYAKVRILARQPTSFKQSDYLS
jgi:hypothetical protein